MQQHDTSSTDQWVIDMRPVPYIYHARAGTFGYTYKHSVATCDNFPTNSEYFGRGICMLGSISRLALSAGSNLVTSCRSMESGLRRVYHILPDSYDQLLDRVVCINMHRYLRGALPTHPKVVTQQAVSVLDLPCRDLLNPFSPTGTFLQQAMPLDRFIGVNHGWLTEDHQPEAVQT